MKRILVWSTVALLLSACGSGSDDAPTDDASTENTATPTPTKDPDHPLGEEANLTVAKVTVLEHKKGIPDGGSPPDDGLRLDAALLRVCNVSYKKSDSEAFGELTDPFNFSLIDGDDGSYDLYDLTPSPAPQPQFADRKVLDPGECTKGWMAFDLPKDAKPIRITYSPGGDEAAAWTLK